MHLIKPNHCILALFLTLTFNPLFSVSYFNVDWFQDWITGKCDNVLRLSGVFWNFYAKWPWTKSLLLTHKMLLDFQEYKNVKCQKRLKQSIVHTVNLWVCVTCWLWIMGCICSKCAVIVIKFVTALLRLHWISQWPICKLHMNVTSPKVTRELQCLIFTEMLMFRNILMYDLLTISHSQYTCMNFTSGSSYDLWFFYLEDALARFLSERNTTSNIWATETKFINQIQ